jgi:hypothetical protein
MEDNKYKNMYTPQNGRVIITLSDGNFNTSYYPSEIKPFDTYATINL